MASVNAYIVSMEGRGTSTLHNSELKRMKVTYLWTSYVLVCQISKNFLWNNEIGRPYLGGYDNGKFGRCP